MTNREEDNRLNRFLDGEKRFIDELKNVDTNKNWARFERTLKEKASQEKTKRIYRSPMFRMAAALLILLAISSAIIYITRIPEQQLQLISAAEKSVDLELSDGSKVSLNTGSQLSFPESMSHRKREVALAGEAYFDIIHHKNRPFIVHVENSEIKVLGTSFNIKSEGNGDIVVSVISGKVLFTEVNNEHNSITLEAGEMGILNKESKHFTSRDFYSENFLYWRTDSLSFKHMPLDSVFRELESHFDVEIVIKDPEINKNKLTTSCKNQKLTEILDEIIILFDLDYTVKGDSIIIQKKQ